MQIQDGRTVAYRDYIAEASRRSRGPVAWHWQEIEAALACFPHDKQGTVALVDPFADEASAFAPGLSMVVQILLPGEATPSHSHSFWHLYIVRSGKGAGMLGDDGIRDPLGPGDLLFVPAWCPHAVSNAGDKPLVMLRMQNLPQNAGLGTLAREEGGMTKLIYADRQ